MTNDPDFLERLLPGAGVPHIPFHTLQIGREVRQPSLGREAGLEPVQNPDLVPAGVERFGRLGANKASPARHEETHGEASEKAGEAELRDGRAGGRTFLGGDSREAINCPIRIDTTFAPGRTGPRQK